MSLVRKIALVVSSLIFGTLLMGFVVASVFRLVFGSPSQPKAWLANSGVYDSIVDSVIEQTRKPTGQQQAGELPLNEPAIAAVAKQAFPPVLLKSATENVIDGTYRWLDGTARQPDFRVDLGPAKQQLAAGIGGYVNTRLASLPICSPQQFPEVFDVFSVQCMPAGFSPATEAQRIEDEILGQKDFLGNPVITAADFKSGDSNKTVFEDAEQAPRFFRLSLWLPFVLGLLSLLVATALIYLSDNPRTGFKKVATRLITTGILIVISLVLIRITNENLADKLGQGSIQQVSAKLAQAAGQAISRVLIIFGIAFFAIAATIYVWVSKLDSPKPPSSPN